MALLLWEGPSPLNGQQIGAFATIDSDNVKTGKSVQTWILLRAEAPHVAQKTGRDEAICGRCPQRPLLGGNCYVTTFMGPNAVWRQWRDQKCVAGSLDYVRKKALEFGLLRLGAYGDPALLPEWLLDKLCVGMPITGYTHQWRNPRFAFAKKYLMASVESVEGAAQAVREGWRYFRVGEGKLRGEVSCPASKEAGNKLQCRQCKACDGLFTGKKSNICIMEH